MPPLIVETEMTAGARKAAREMAREYLCVDMLATTVPLGDVVDDIIDAYEAALAKTHVIVPREATEEMVEAVARDWKSVLNAAQVEVLYRAMLAASPRVEG
jgi:hypothetical protein